MGVKPLKNKSDISLSPQVQKQAVLGLLGKANPQGSSDIQTGVSALNEALSSTGLGDGGLMASVGATSLNFSSLIPHLLSDQHFGGSENE